MFQPHPILFQGRFRQLAIYLEGPGGARLERLELEAETSAPVVSYHQSRHRRMNPALSLVSSCTITSK